MSHAIVVHCPACAAGYLLPGTLLGPLGARVTCPACRAVFDVDRAGAPAASSPAGEAARPVPPREGAADDGRAIAAEVLDELERRAGPDLARAVEEGRLFRDHGPALLDAFDEYRHRAGERAGGQAFGEEVRRRWNAEIFPPSGARG